ncbi:hypothetical protein V8D89_014947, partial [Ganoderma adspersum]
MRMTSYIDSGPCFVVEPSPHLTDVSAMSVVLNSSSFEGTGSSFAIPYNTLRGVSTELVDVKEGLDRMKVQMVSALLATIFIVCPKESTPLALPTPPKFTCGSASHNRRFGARGLKRSPRILLCVIAAMYTATFVSWVTLLVTQFRTLSEVKSNVLQTYTWIPPEDCFVLQSVQNMPAYCTTLPAAPTSISGHWDSTQ